MTLRTPTARPSALSSTGQLPRRWSWALVLVLLRVVAALHAVLAVLQPVWIGGYLSGVYPLLGRHAVFAGLLILSAMALGVVGIAYAVAGGRIGAAGLGLFFLAEGLQTGMGYARTLAVHIPLGVGIVGGAVAVAVWSWTPSAARDRRAVR